MKTSLVTLILFVNVLTCAAQYKYEISLGSGVGWYKHADLKKWQSEQELNSSNIGLKNINNFPPYFYYTGEVVRKFGRKTMAGVAYRFESTGYKSSYADYSGRMKYEQQVYVNKVGIMAGYQCWSAGKWSILSTVKAYYSWSTIHLSRELMIGGDPLEHAMLNYVSENIQLNPECNIRYKINERLALNATFGYCFDLKGDIEYRAKRDLSLTFGNSHEAAQSDWSGFRSGLSLSYLFW